MMFHPVRTDPRNRRRSNALAQSTNIFHQTTDTYYMNAGVFIYILGYATYITSKYFFPSRIMQSSLFFSMSPSCNIDKRLLYPLPTAVCVPCLLIAREISSFLPRPLASNSAYQRKAL